MNDRAKFKETVREMRHRLIIDAAVTVFSEFGFRGASMKQIALLAGVSEGTIYNVFEDKLDLLVSILDPLAERLNAEPSRPSSSMGGALGARLSAFDGKTAAMMRVLLSEALIDEEVRKQFGERIIAPMRPRKPDAAQYAALSFVLGAIVLRLLGQDDRKGERAVLGLFDSIVMAERAP